jgi:hypothetical protein
LMRYGVPTLSSKPARGWSTTVFRPCWNIDWTLEAELLRPGHPFHGSQSGSLKGHPKPEHQATR